MEEHLTNK